MDLGKTQKIIEEQEKNCLKAMMIFQLMKKKI